MTHLVLQILILALGIATVSLICAAYKAFQFLLGQLQTNAATHKTRAHRVQPRREGVRGLSPTIKFSDHDRQVIEEIAALQALQWPSANSQNVQVFQPGSPVTLKFLNVELSKMPESNLARFLRKETDDKRIDSPQQSVSGILSANTNPSATGSSTTIPLRVLAQQGAI